MGNKAGFELLDDFYLGGIKDFVIRDLTLVNYKEFSPGRERQ